MSRSKKASKFIEYLDKYLDDLQRAGGNIVYAMVFERLVKRVKKGYYNDRQGELIRELFKLGLDNLAKERIERKTGFNKIAT